MGKNMKCDHYCAEQPSEPACTPQRPSSRHQNAERNTGCTSAEQKETWETFCACFLSVSEEENAFDILKPHHKNLASFFGLQQSDHQPGWQHPAARGGRSAPVRSVPMWNPNHILDTLTPYYVFAACFTLRFDGDPDLAEEGCSI